MIRTIIVVLFITIFLILSIPVWGILWIVGLFNKTAKDRIGYSIVAGAFNVVWHLAGVKPIVNGLENVPKDRSVLFVGNHLSYFDVVLTYSLCPPVTGFLAKDSIKKVPLLSTWMKHNYCLFLTRTNPKEDLKLILQAIEFAKNGISIFAFPEGTRSKTGEMGEFHEAVFKVSTKSGCPIVPVSITGTRDILEAHFPFIKRTKVVITYGEPIYLDQLAAEDKKFIGAYTKKIIAAQLELDKQLVK